MALTFTDLDRQMQAECERVFGRVGTSPPGASVIYHPMRERPSARPVVDTNRAVRALPDVIVSPTHERVNLGDNGMGRLSGRNNLSLAADAVEISFAKAHLPYQPMRRDEVTIDADRYAVAEVMDDGGSAWALVLNRIAA